MHGEACANGRFAVPMTAVISHHITPLIKRVKV